MTIKLNRWTPEEDALLEQHGDAPATREAWQRLAEFRFPGRSGHACRARYQSLQRRTIGVEQEARVRRSEANGGLTFASRVDREAEALAEAEEARRQYHPTITGHFFGDPLPGRSALDKRNAEAVA